VATLFFFFVDSDSPYKDLLFTQGPNLAQKPLYLVGTVLKYFKATVRLAPKGCKLTFSREHTPEVLQILCAQMHHQNIQITLKEARVTSFTSLQKNKSRIDMTINEMSAIFFNIAHVWCPVP